ncbi:MAG: cell division protein ZapA [Lachnospiraceae bacterium]|nr:cell division protein ZapA [Lachnospiraceae bacterium]
MAEKNYTEVNLIGKTYKLGGYEEESYLQHVATYINGKQAELMRMQGFLRQKEDYRQMMLLLNVADDYFKATQQCEALRAKQEELEKTIYELKHELVSSRMRYENE